MKHRLLRYFGQPGNSWRYALAEDYGMHTKYLCNVHFENKWLTINDGDLVVKAGYAWDGCSPCVSVLGLFYVGPPDGAQLLGNPATYHASLVHDVLCQFRHQIPISKATSVAVFRELMDKSRFPLARVYATAVAFLGPQNFQLESSLPQRIRASRRKHIPHGSGTESPARGSMQTRSLFGYLAALALGMLTLIPYFLFGGEVSSRQMMWVRTVITAAVLFSPVRLLGRPQLRLTLVFCLPVAIIGSILGFAESHNFWASLLVTSEPILCAWLGASLAWIVLRFLPLRV